MKAMNVEKCKPCTTKDEVRSALLLRHSKESGRGLGRGPLKMSCFYACLLHFLPASLPAYLLSVEQFELVRDINCVIMPEKT